MADRVRAVAWSGAAGLGGFLGGLLVVLLLASALSSIDALPVRVLKVLSGSMSPAIETGDAVIVQSVTPDAVRVGDVVTFRDPEDGSRLLTHRVRAVTTGPAGAQFVTRGDANDAGERWSVSGDGKVGLVRQRLPRAGFVLARLQSRPGRVLLLVLPALALCALELRQIWRRRPTEHAQLSLF